MMRITAAIGLLSALATFNITIEREQARLNDRIARNFVKFERKLFADARNAEIARAYAAAETQRARRFVADRNREIETSVAAYDAAREARFIALRNDEIDRAVVASAKEQERRFVAQRNTEIERAMVASAGEQERRFIAQRNAEIEFSVAAVEQRFILDRNTEIERSMVASADEQGRRFVAQRNAEIETAVALSTGQRGEALIASLEDLADRSMRTVIATQANIEADAASARTEAARMDRLAAIINAESELSLARVAAARTDTGTGAIQTATVNRCVPTTERTFSIAFEPRQLRVGGQHVATLKRLAEIATRCPASTIEMRWSGRVSGLRSVSPAELQMKHLHSARLFLGHSGIAAGRIVDADHDAPRSDEASDGAPSVEFAIVE